MNHNKYRHHHIGIPATSPIEGEIYLKDYKVYHYGYDNSEFGIEWMLFPAPHLTP